ncbi:hypothetical protein RB195_025339 [Necator americanus]|uniref:Uncharacterized protein n=1 Tax=Necator americanus TaxID=51031 RepID=A0ABR1ES38_NECAM
MATSLKTWKRVLARHTNTLLQLLTQYTPLGDETMLSDESLGSDALTQIKKAEIQIKPTQVALEKALYAFTEAVDNLENPLTDEEDKKVSEYMDKAQETISETESLLTRMEISKQLISAHGHTNPQGSRAVPKTVANANLAARFELPKIPIPEFTGKSWQWDNFWELFNATVHSSPIPDLQKFNYLLRALKGEAKESIARFQVTSSNYALAVAYLQEKYGNVQIIVTSLHQKLEQWCAKSSMLKDQRKLYDQLSVITAQLERKGESLDSPWLLSKILSKFTETIQRRALNEKVSLPRGETWTLNKLMTSLDVILKQEEKN